jgi:hypothetical protein
MGENLLRCFVLGDSEWHWIALIQQPNQENRALTFVIYHQRSCVLSLDRF